MSDMKPKQMHSPGGTKRSPLLGVSTDEHDLSTGHEGSRLDKSLLEGNHGQNIQDKSLMDPAGS